MTKLFELTEQESRLTNVNHRVEKFGEENVLACDLALSFTTANDFLSQLHPTLKWSLYDRPATPDLADHDDHMPLLRYPKIERLAWDQEWTNCELTIHRLKDDIKLVDCKVNKIRIEPQQGGSVTVSFRVQFHPDDSKPATLGKLDAMLKDGVVTISLARPLDSEEPVQTNTPEANPVEKAAADLAKSKSFGANGRRRGAAVSAPE